MIFIILVKGILNNFQEKMSTSNINCRHDKVEVHADDDNNVTVCRENGFLHRYKKCILIPSYDIYIQLALIIGLAWAIKYGS